MPHDAGAVYPYRYQSSSSSSSPSSAAPITSSVVTKKADDKTIRVEAKEHQIEAKEGLRDIIDHLLGTDTGTDIVIGIETTTAVRPHDDGTVIVKEGKDDGLMMGEEKQEKCATFGTKETNVTIQTHPFELRQVPSSKTQVPSSLSPDTLTQEQLVSRNNVVYHASYIWQSDNNRL